MSTKRIKQLLKLRESTRVEFKESYSKLPSSLFETISGMLNRNGGDILLGVRDDGVITGVNPANIDIIKTNLTNLSNNSEKLNPPFILFPRSYIINDKHIIHIQVPESSQLHMTTENIFDRSNDGDFLIKEPQQIADIYNRKRNHYTEGIIYPEVKKSDFKTELFSKVFNLIKNNEPNHPWLKLSDEQMLQKAGLWKKDYQTSNEGYTLAAILLFGKDEVIQQILPQYKIDAIVRKENTDRYDDRIYIRTNLIDAYDQMLEFVSKHLPDKFYTQGDQRISLRTTIFREIIANLIVHREYTNALPASLIIYNDNVTTTNANNPNVRGTILPDNFYPYPKNPLISKFFIQLGRVDELGSGIINVNKYLTKYAGKVKPLFLEDYLFKTVIPLTDKVIIDKNIKTGILKKSDIKSPSDLDKIFEIFSDSISNKLHILYKAIEREEGRRTPYYKKVSKLKDSDRTIERYIKLLKDNGFIVFKGESTKTGGYYIPDVDNSDNNQT